MYSIGKFSKLTGLSTKTLIWYDNIGLLKPDFVNEENGYRYYTADSIKRLANIQFLQSLDFSINEIMNLTESVISNKIQHLRKKIDYIEANISFLENIKGGTMNEKVLTMYDVQKSKEHQARIQGKWAYALSTNKFAEAIAPVPSYHKDRPNDMPKELFFGEEQSGTDTENILYYSIDKINIKEKTYTFLIMNLDESLILFERQDPFSENEKEQEFCFHVYRRLGNTPFTRKQLEQIMKKADYRKKKFENSTVQYDNRLDGVWKHIDNIKESEIKDYKETDKKDTFNILYPMFDKLFISGKDVSVMAEDDKFTITNKNHKTVYTSENSKMKLGISPDDVFIENPILNVRHRLQEKIIGKETYLFVNFTNELDIDENTTIYVYKKLKGEQK